MSAQAEQVIADIAEELGEEAAKLKAHNAALIRIIQQNGNLMHPDDPGGSDDWTLGTCESNACVGRPLQLIQLRPCEDPECRGCISMCLECGR